MYDEQDRDLTDPVARSSAAAQCLLQFRDEMDARGEVDDWDWYTALGRTIDRHFGQRAQQVFRRIEE